MEWKQPKELEEWNGELQIMQFLELGDKVAVIILPLCYLFNMCRRCMMMVTTK
jgi:hypothetical protein